jgi:hypothetical protein
MPNSFVYENITLKGRIIFSDDTQAEFLNLLIILFLGICQFKILQFSKNAQTMLLAKTLAIFYIRG